MTLRRQVSLGLLLFPSELHYRAKKLKFKKNSMRLGFSNPFLIVWRVFKRDLYRHAPFDTRIDILGLDTDGIDHVAALD